MAFICTETILKYSLFSIHTYAAVAQDEAGPPPVAKDVVTTAPAHNEAGHPAAAPPTAAQDEARRPPTAAQDEARRPPPYAAQDKDGHPAAAQDGDGLPVATAAQDKNGAPAAAA